LGSKPAAHVAAMAELDDTTLNAGMPKAIGRLMDMVAAMLKELPE
jgi:putative ATP-dependent endonuclease of OLD family